jgi:hypothetical protein
MQRIESLALIVLVLTALATPSAPLAATFCVGSAAELQNALSIAGHNGVEDYILLRAGTYEAATPASAEADFHLAVMDGMGLTLRGGWTTGCGGWSRVAGRTRFSSGSGRRALNIVFPPGGTSNIVWMENIEFAQDGAGGSSLATCAINVSGRPLLGLFNLRFRGIDCPSGGLMRFSGPPGGSLHVGNVEFSDNRSADPLLVVEAGSGLAYSRWVHLTLAYNTVTGSDLLLHDRDGDSDVTFENSVVWGNQLQAHEGGYRQIELGQQPNAAIRFNRLQTQSPRIPHLVWGNSVGDPGFEDGPRPRPRADSPLRNGGQMTDYTDYFVYFDLQGHPRTSEGSVDIGAYEYLPPLFVDGFENAIH